ncbi:MAG: DUF2917 domain-containing protein [Denitromonas halophila]|nr:MAG: DUF2917 domain-containing protein [Denitromonas halophila]
MFSLALSHPSLGVSPSGASATARTRPHGGGLFPAPGRWDFEEDMTMHASDDVRWTVELNPGSVLRLPPGTTVGCRAGSVWLTEYRPGRDVLLAAGDVHTAGGAGPVVVTGRAAASLVLGATDDSVGRRLLRAMGEACVGLGNGLRQRGERVGTGLHHRPGLPAR